MRGRRARLSRRAHRRRAAGRQHGLLRRCDAVRRRAPPNLAVAHAPEPGSRARPHRLHVDRRGRRRARAGSRGRACAALAVSAQHGFRGLGADRRQSFDQCRRARRAALRHDARPRSRPRSGAAERRGARGAERPAQGQHGLRLQGIVLGSRGHARRHHGRRAQAVSGAAGARDRVARGGECRRRLSAARPCAPRERRPGRLGRVRVAPLARSRAAPRRRRARSAALAGRALPAARARVGRSR